MTPLLFAVLLVTVSIASLQGSSAFADLRHAARRGQISPHSFVSAWRDTHKMTAEDQDVPKRRELFEKAAFTIVASLVGASESAQAFDKGAYPVELNAADADRDSRERKVESIRIKEAQRTANPLVETPIFSSALWSIALWFLLGSRSNPIATPLANLIYDKQQEEWLQDRNDGLFAYLPWEFLVIIFFAFFGLGFLTDIVTTTLAEGARDSSIQLACVAIIGGCSLELGRIASGNKKLTRDEYDRSEELRTEFSDFAENRLKNGGNCHRSEVVRAFRRYFAKYRSADNEEYPLLDLEIEQLLRSHCKAIGIKMSSSGFYSGIQINKEADAFVSQ